MGIKYRTVWEDGLGTVAKIVVISDHESLEAFKQLVHRATNLWPDAPAAIKEFSDMVLHGKTLQDYYNAENKDRRAEKAAEKPINEPPVLQKDPLS
ncbi:MAG: hypothetical protein AB7F19_07605 [Candidatus Babeliales bacterium]